LLSRLLAGGGSLRKFRSSLRDTRHRPAELTRSRRAAHLGVLTALLFVGAGCCMFPAGWLIDAVPGMMWPGLVLEEEKSLRHLDEGAWRDFAASGAGAGPACWPALGLLHADLSLRERLREKIEGDRLRADAQLKVLGPISRQQALMSRKSMEEQQALKDKDPASQARTSNRRRDAEEALGFDDKLPQVEAALQNAAYGMLLAWPALWVVGAFLLRGGLSYRIVGIELVRSDGRPALRLQCAWRALLVWAPLTGLLVLSLWLQIRFWSDWDRGDVRLGLHTVATVLWYAALALPAVYAALALARPARAPHDRLAGTYLVPR
jgi:hypothetical protein